MKLSISRIIALRRSAKALINKGGKYAKAGKAILDKYKNIKTKRKHKR